MSTTGWISAVGPHPPPDQLRPKQPHVLAASPRFHRLIPHARSLFVRSPVLRSEARCGRRRGRAPSGRAGWLFFHQPAGLLVWIAVCASSASFGLASEKASLTSDKAQIAPESYRLSVEDQALIWAKDSFPRFIVWPSQAFDIQEKKSIASLRAAEEAVRLDERNAYAHALLARYYLIPEDTLDAAREHWKMSFDNGIGISFPSMYYDVDDQRLFMSHIRKDGIYIYTYGQFDVDTMKELPDETNTRYWEAHAGHIPDDLGPVAIIYWNNVREIKTGNWVWWLKLKNKVTVRSDRGKEESLDEVKVALLGGVGKFDWHLDWWNLAAHRKINIRTHTYGPADYNARLRSVVLELIDPDGRIEAPKAPKPGPGW